MVDQIPPADFPNLYLVSKTGRVGIDFSTDFEPGLDIVLEGLARVPPSIDDTASGLSRLARSPPGGPHGQPVEDQPGDQEPGVQPGIGVETDEVDRRGHSAVSRIVAQASAAGGPARLHAPGARGRRRLGQLGPAARRPDGSHRWPAARGASSAELDTARAGPPRNGSGIMGARLPSGRRPRSTIVGSAKQTRPEPPRLLDAAAPSQISVRGGAALDTHRQRWRAPPTAGSTTMSTPTPVRGG